MTSQGKKRNQSTLLEKKSSVSVQTRAVCLVSKLGVTTDILFLHKLHTCRHAKKKRRNATRRVSLRQYRRTSEVPKFLCFYRAPKSRQDPIKARTAVCDEEPRVLMLKLYVFTAQDTGMYRSSVLLTHLHCNQPQYFTLYRFQWA